jgi:biopolymer transport protein ExbD
MVGHGILGNTSFHSALGSASILAPKSERTKRNIVAELLLTALIDAFSILVIFLLMSFSSTGEILYMSKGMELPKSTQAELLELTPIVKLDDGQIYLEDKLVAAADLTAGFMDLRTKYQETHPGQEFPAVLTIQADRRIKYELISQVVAAASQAGVSDIKFATLLK